MLSRAALPRVTWITLFTDTSLEHTARGALQHDAHATQRGRFIDIRMYVKRYAWNFFLRHHSDTYMYFDTQGRSADGQGAHLE